MQTITFTCEVITPMFLAGADGTTPELRPPSLKGALRFWWRAMNGHLPLDELKKREAMIFGDTSQRSAFSITISHDKIKTFKTELLPHKKASMQREAFEAGQKFEIKMVLNRVDIFSLVQLKSLCELTIILGGLGKRSRRGMGAFRLVNCKLDNVEYSYSNFVNLPKINELLKIHTPYYTVINNSIECTYIGRQQNYGWIKQIKIGERKSHENTPLLTSRSTHEIKKEYGGLYEPNMGHAFRGKFASPVIVSAYESAYSIVVTTLNTIPDRGVRDLDLMIQDKFKNKILK